MSNHDGFPRIATLKNAGGQIFEFAKNPAFARRKGNPDALDFTLGNPNEPLIAGYAEAMQKWAVPQHERWYGYNTSIPEAQKAAAEGLARWTGVQFKSEHLVMTNGGFGAISAGLKAVASPGHDVIFCRPPWFNYEMMIREAALNPVKVSLDLTTFELDIDAIRGAITPNTGLVIVNTPHNPTGKIYQPGTLKRLAVMLDEESRRIGRTIYLLSDEVYNRILFDGARFHTPAAYYPFTLVAYSYGKTHLTAGQRIGYLAMAPAMPNHEQIRDNIEIVLLASGYAYPSMLLQHAVPDLEKLSIDIGHIQRKRDHFLGSLRQMGYEVQTPEATLWLLPRSPWNDDIAYAEKLTEHNIFVVPGTVCEIPGYFRISLTASDEMIDRSLPGFQTAMDHARAHDQVLAT